MSKGQSLTEPPKTVGYWIRYNMCGRKKQFAKPDAQEYCLKHPKFDYYKCEYCNSFHLTTKRKKP
jgi:hypothetical protein